MRNFKRFLALVLAMLMLSGMTFVSAAAAEEGDYTDAAQRLHTIGVLKGDENGNLMLDQGVKRWQTALFFVQALTATTDASELNATKNSDYFNDVVEYGTAIDYAYGAGVVKGRGNGVYGYHDDIIYQDMLVMAVRALEYETSEMSYPWGHIMAAEKLGITDGIVDLQYTDPLTRGETAQIIWNMMETPIAFVDPITNKIVYPDEASASDAILGTTAADREKRLLDPFTQDKISGVITKYNAAKLSTDVATVELKVDSTTTYTLAAADLGITDKTAKATYLNLPATIYIDCKIADFEKMYDAESDENEASIVFTNFTQFTNVQNLGDDGNIKYAVDADTGVATLTLSGTKFASDKYIFDVRTLGAGGWEEETDDEGLLDAFTYTKKDGYTGDNSYGEMDYVVIDDTPDVKNDAERLLVLYKPYEFGRYHTRETRYLGAKTNIVTIARYVVAGERPDSYKNMGDVSTYFVEYTLGANGEQLDKDSTSVSMARGELSATVTVTGETASNDDFVFYYLNELDAILDIAMNCGATNSGRLTSYNEGKETVKINGTNYEYGFAGAYNAPDSDNQLPEFDYSPADSRSGFLQRLIDTLEAGYDNVYYVKCGDNVVYMQYKEGSTVNTDHEFIIIETNDTILKALDKNYQKHMVAVTNSATSETINVYVKDDKVMAAVLNTTSGKWQLAPIATFEMGELKSDGTYETDYNLKNNDNEYPVSVSLGEAVNYYTTFSEYNGFDELWAALNYIENGGIFMLRGGDASTGYTIAAINNQNTDYIEYGTTTDGLVFSDISPVTNKFSALHDGSSDGRKTLKSSSVVVFIDKDGNVGVRTGIQKTTATIKGDGRFYSGTGDLIVFVADDVVNDKSGGVWTASNWQGAVTSVDENWYIALKDSSISQERTGDGYTLTVENVFDLKALRKVNSISDTVDTLDETNLYDDFAPGKVLHMSDSGELTVSTDSYETALLDATNAVSNSDDEYYPIEIFEFVDEWEIGFTLEDGTNNGAGYTHDSVNAVRSIKIDMATLDLTTFDNEDYDINKMAIAKTDVPTNADYLDKLSSVDLASKGDKNGYSYYVEGFGEVSTITEPVSNKLDRFVLDTEGETLLVPVVKEDYYDNAEQAQFQLYMCGQYDDGDLTVYVLKVLADK